ncbi:hypothetical protein ABZ721_30625 [Streptomyces sp. NPDC006733]|uniref:hypothetical protein n=1 Tax=Streptomyces sp. NPDC006733 TaxID=3155460 RepID=UPI003400BDF7
MSLAVASLVGSSCATASAAALSPPAPSPVVVHQTGPEARAADIGLFLTDGDEVHYSTWTKNSPAAMSGHGWWIKGTTKATKAKVTIWLEVKSGSSWRVVGQGTKTVYPGGGSARRATARMVCAAGPIPAGKTYTYRTRIDVDLIGHADSAEQAVTTPKAYPCLPTS